MSNVTGFYTHNGNIYAQNADRVQTDEAREASAYVLSMILKNDRARQKVENWAQDVETASALTAYTFTEVAADPLFWFYMGAMSRPPVIVSPGWGRMHPVGGGGCCPSGACSGAGKSGDEKAVLAILILIAIAILVVAIIATLGLTVKHGADAEKARKHLEKIKQKYNKTTNPNVKNVYSHIVSIQREEWASQSIKTALTAISVVGGTLLTVSAIFALYAVINGTAVSPYASYIAMAGGGAIGISLAGHVFRQIILCVKRSRDLEKLHQLYLETMKLQIPTPYTVLAQTNFEKAYLKYNDRYFIKSEDKYYTKPSAPPIKEFPPDVQIMLNDIS